MHRKYYEYFKISFLKKLTDNPSIFTGTAEEAYDRLIMRNNIEYYLDNGDIDEINRYVAVEHIYRLANTFGVDIMHPSKDWYIELRKLKIQNVIK